MALPTPPAGNVPSSIIKGIEAFVFVFLAQFIISITALGHPIDINTATGHGEIITAALAAIGIALRSWQASDASKK